MTIHRPFALLSLSIFVLAAPGAWAAPGDVFMLRSATNEIVRFDPETGAETVIAALMAAENPFSIAIAGNDDIFVTDIGVSPQPSPGTADGKVWRVTQSGTVTEVASGGFLVRPTGIDVEPDGNLIVVDNNDQVGNGGFDVQGRVIRIDLTTGAQTLLAEGEATIPSLTPKATSRTWRTWKWPPTATSTSSRTSSVSCRPSPSIPAGS